MDTLAYKQTLQAALAETAPDGVTQWTDPNGLCSADLGHPANGGLTQRSECDAYNVEVAGSNPAAPTSQSTEALLIAEAAIRKTLKDRIDAFKYQLYRGPQRIDKMTRIGRHLGRLGIALLEVRAALGIPAGGAQ